MARMPGASWIGPTGNENPGQESTVFGLVAHIQQGTEPGTEAWQRNPASQVSSHFLLPKAGGIRQMVDTADKAWAEVAGNAHWISAEIEGNSGDSLTVGQLAGLSAILAWLHQSARVPLRVCADPLTVVSVDSGGLTWHAAGGVAWGNHPDCPGATIINQLPAVVTTAERLTGATMDETLRTAHNSDTYLWHLSQMDTTIPGIYGNDGTPMTLPNRVAVVLGEIVNRLQTIENALQAPGQPPTQVPSAHDIAAEIIAQLRPASQPAT